MRKHLTLEQRYLIYGYIQAGYTKSRIAKALGVSKSTITREIQKNGDGSLETYRPKVAQRYHDDRMRLNRKPRKMTEAMVACVTTYLRDYQLSPDEIVGRRRLRGKETVSSETIYKWIWKRKKIGSTYCEYYLYLRRKGRNHRKRGALHNSRSFIPERVDISERPEIVDMRNRVGDYEIDTIVGANQKQHILTVVDRATGLLRMRKLKPATAEHTAEMIIDALKEDAAMGNVHTITADNGFLFRNHKTVTEKLGVQVYFARPYHSWERGTNENTNGLVRQYLPKHTSFEFITDEMIQSIENNLNRRPRKRLNYYTPDEYYKSLTNTGEKVAI